MTVSDPHSTRSPFLEGNPYYRAHARTAIALYREGAPTLEQSIALERITVRMHGRANRHELGEWHAGDGLDQVVTCSGCGARATLSLETGVANVAGILVRCPA